MSSTIKRGSLYRQYSKGSSENLPPKTIQRVGREVRDLHKSPPEGVRLVLDAETGVPASLGEVLADIEGPVETPYEGKYFQIKLVLSPDFPNSPPRGHFLTKIYHPNVDVTTGAICVNTLKKDWTPDTTFSHVLHVIRCLLIIPFPESSLNDEAGKLFMESYDEYAKRARLMANIHARPIKASEENEGARAAVSSSSISGGSDRSLKAMNRACSNNKSKSLAAEKKKKKSLRRL